MKTVFLHRNFNMSTSFSLFEYIGYAWNLIMDNNSIFFFKITKINYSKKLIMVCFEELQIQYYAKQINTNQNVKDLQFNNNLLLIFKKLYAKYNDSFNDFFIFDSFSKVTEKIEQFKDIIWMKIMI